jgi:hypothetical protein
MMQMIDNKGNARVRGSRESYPTLDTRESFRIKYIEGRESPPSSYGRVARSLACAFRARSVAAQGAVDDAPKIGVASTAI